MTRPEWPDASALIERVCQLERENAGMRAALGDDGLARDIASGFVYTALSHINAYRTAVMERAKMKGQT